MTPLFVAGLPVSQQRPPGSPAAGPQRAGGRAGAGGGDVFTETEPDGKRRQQNTKGEIFKTSHIKKIIIWCHCVDDWGQTNLLMSCRCDICAAQWGGIIAHVWIKQFF